MFLILPALIGRRKIKPNSSLMHVLILGAGLIGRAVAEALISESNDITVIDKNPDCISALQHPYDVKGIIGDATSPRVLREAGIEDADIAIAVTDSDEKNLVISLLAAKLFNVPTRIARVRRRELGDCPALLGEDGFLLTSSIWPERAIITTLLEHVQFPQARQIINFAEGSLSMVSVTLPPTSLLVGHRSDELSSLVPGIPVVLVSAMRKDLPLHEEVPFNEGDDLLVLIERNRLAAWLAQTQGPKSLNKNIIICGNAALAPRLASTLQDQGQYNIKVLGDDEAMLSEASYRFSDRTLLVRGSPLVEEDLASVDIDACDLFISLSDSDEQNILSALLAKRLGAKRVLALVDNLLFSDLVKSSGIDIFVSQIQATLGEILLHVRRGDVVSVHALHHGRAEALEIVVHGTPETSKIVGRSLKALPLPQGTSIVALVRSGAVLLPNPESIVEPNDRVIVYSNNRQSALKLEKLFAVSVGFF